MNFRFPSFYKIKTNKIRDFSLFFAELDFFNYLEKLLLYFLRFKNCEIVHHKFLLYFYMKYS